MRKAERLALTAVIALQFSLCSTGCAILKKHFRTRGNLARFSGEELKGLTRVELIQEFGKPQAISTSGISESWYYSQPQQFWIWFEDNKVKHWEVQKKD